jgi:hypothetical protein
MAMAVFAAQQANLPNPQPMSRFTNDHPNTVRFMNDLRPNIIFFDPVMSAVQLWEARGGRGGDPSQLMTEARSQANAALDVAPPGGARIIPSGRAASVAFHNDASNRWELQIVALSRSVPSHCPLPPKFRDDFYRKFYEPFIKMLSNPGAPPKSIKYGKNGFLVTRLDPVSMWVGIHDKIHLAMKRPFSQAGQLATLLESILRDLGGVVAHDEDVYINRSGIVAALDKKWNLQDGA